MCRLKRKFKRNPSWNHSWKPVWGYLLETLSAKAGPRTAQYLAENPLTEFDKKHVLDILAALVRAGLIDDDDANSWAGSSVRTAVVYDMKPLQRSAHAPHGGEGASRQSHTAATQLSPAFVLSPGTVGGGGRVDVVIPGAPGEAAPLRDPGAALSIYHRNSLVDYFIHFEASKAGTIHFVVSTREEAEKVKRVLEPEQRLYAERRVEILIMERGMLTKAEFWREERVRRGDTLAAILARLDVDESDAKTFATGQGATLSSVGTRHCMPTPLF